MNNPSTLDGRNTYTTSVRGLNAGAAPIQGTPDGFEFAARVMVKGGFLAFISIAMHETTQTGIYVLLLDQTVSSTVAAGQSTRPFANGDLALITLGPTSAAVDPTSGNPLAATIVFSESEAEARVKIGTSRGLREFRGFPFDTGCIAVLSSTPGRLTQLVGQVGDNPPLGGARFTARTQGC